MNLTSWSESPPIGFWFNVLIWGVLGCAMLITPVFYFLKAIRDTSGVASLPGEKTLLPIYRKWKELPESFQIVFVSTVTLSSILVGFYLLTLFAPR